MPPRVMVPLRDAKVPAQLYFPRSVTAEAQRGDIWWYWKSGHPCKQSVAIGRARSRTVWVAMPCPLPGSRQGARQAAGYLPRSFTPALELNLLSGPEHVHLSRHSTQRDYWRISNGTRIAPPLCAGILPGAGAGGGEVFSSSPGTPGADGSDTCALVISRSPPIPAATATRTAPPASASLIFTMLDGNWFSQIICGGFPPP
jgi:hypothetical protein